MSRGYRIQWATASRVVKTTDKITLQVGFLGILSEEEMRRLFRDELVRDGWKQQKGGKLSAEVSGVKVELDAEGKTVTATTGGERIVEGRALTAAEAQERAEARQAQTEKALLREAGERLARIEPDLRAGLEAAVQRVYVEALKRKAASFGAVESCSESTAEDGTHEVLIKVRT